MTFRGLTWEHPRGYQALTAAQGSLIHGKRQPPEGFESYPIEDLAARYDLVPINLPFAGEAMKAACFRPSPRANAARGNFENRRGGEPL